MMDGEETKNCPNCKREIPAVNFTIHSVHCARNIRICPVCKEPVPGHELDDHHKKLHKLLPCKQCGESVCGTDLEDHIRDSCAHTIKTCRYCELELPRRELPAHEGYCGVRTEQCGECREWVMLKYRQLHLDSNHGFLRLDDDPPPPKKEQPKLTICPNSVANARRALTSVNANGAPSIGPSWPNSVFDDAGPSNFRNDFPRTQSRHLGSSNSGSSATSSNVSPQEGASGVTRPVNGVKKRTNDQPQINTNKEVANKVDKDLAISRGAVKKRVAPPPPRPAPPAPPASPRRDLPYYSALQRQQREERDRREQNEYNLAHGLPPVLSPAAKLEKLRKMDALHNRETAEEFLSSSSRNGQPSRQPTLHPLDEDRRRQEFKNLKPMSPEQFAARFSELQLRGDGPAAGDRFTEIKSSLRELRRGLNEVTAPYNNNNVSANNNIDRARTPSPHEEVRLPCEFCNMLVPLDDLVQHQTGCRPDLVQYRAAAPVAPAPAPVAPAPAAPAPRPSPRAAPVIPCEFCAESLPVYLINEHQERCAREVDILSPD